MIVTADIVYEIKKSTYNDTLQFHFYFVVISPCRQAFKTEDFNYRGTHILSYTN